MPLTATLFEITSFTGSPGHACSVFNTADVSSSNCMGKGGGSYNEGYIVNIAEGVICKPQYLFNSGGWYNLPVKVVEFIKCVETKIQV